MSRMEDDPGKIKKFFSLSRRRKTKKQQKEDERFMCDGKRLQFHDTKKQRKIKICSLPWLPWTKSQHQKEEKVKLKEIYGHSRMSIYCKVVFLTSSSPTSRIALRSSNLIIYGLNCVYECPDSWVSLHFPTRTIWKGTKKVFQLKCIGIEKHFDFAMEVETLLRRSNA